MIRKIGSANIKKFRKAALKPTLFYFYPSYPSRPKLVIADSNRFLKLTYHDFIFHVNEFILIYKYNHVKLKFIFNL